MPAVEIVRSVRDIPAGVWDALAPPDDPLWDRQVFLAMENGHIGPDLYRYVVVTEGAEMVAVLPMSGLRGLRLDLVVGPRERRLLSAVGGLLPGLVEVPMLFCGHFIGRGHVLHKSPLPPGVAALLLRTVLEFARGERLGSVIFKDFPPDDPTGLRPALHQHGFFFMPGLPDTELALGHASFEEYLTSLPAKPRRNARSNIRKFRRHSGLRVEVLTEYASLVPHMLRLYRQVMARADQTLDVIDESFLRALHEADGLDQRVVACFEGDELVAYLHCLLRGRGAVGARIGLDYRIAHEARLYHAVHYAAIELAIIEKCRHIRFAQTAYEPKRELGCRLVDQSYAMTHVRPLPRALLRLLLPPALAAARAKALEPRS